MLDQETFQELRHNPAFKALQEQLRAQVAWLQDQWLNGDFRREDPSAYVITDQDAIVRAQTYSDLATLEWKDIEEMQIKMGMRQPKEEESK